MNAPRITASPRLRGTPLRTNYVIDCSGAWITVRKRNAAALLTVDGEIDAVNMGAFYAAVRYYAAVRTSVIVNLSPLDFFNVGAFRLLMALHREFNESGLCCVVIPGAVLRPLLHAVTNHGLTVAPNVTEAVDHMTDATRDSKRASTQPDALLSWVASP